MAQSKSNKTVTKTVSKPTKVIKKSKTFEFTDVDVKSISNLVNKYDEVYIVSMQNDKIIKRFKFSRQYILSVSNIFEYLDGFVSNFKNENKFSTIKTMYK